MKTISPPQSLLLLVLLGYLLAGVGSAFGAVWCLGEEGHAAYRMTPGSHCGHEVSPLGACRGKEGVPPLSGPCRSCIDLSNPLSLFSKAAPRPHKIQKISQGNPPGAACRSSAPDQTRSSDRFWTDISTPNAILAQLKTVVLLN